MPHSDTQHSMIGSGRQTVSGQPEDPVVFFDLVYAAFGRAAQAAAPPIDRFYALGAQTIWLRFAGPGLLAAVLPALAHRIVPDGGEPDSVDRGGVPGWTICIWDSASTGVPMPPPPWPAAAFTVRGEIVGYNNARIQTAFQPDCGVLSLLDVQRKLAI